MDSLPQSSSLTDGTIVEPDLSIDCSSTQASPPLPESSSASSQTSLSAHSETQLRSSAVGTLNQARDPPAVRNHERHLSHDVTLSGERVHRTQGLSSSYATLDGSQLGVTQSDSCDDVNPSIFKKESIYINELTKRAKFDIEYLLFLINL